MKNELLSLFKLLEKRITTIYFINYSNHTLLKNLNLA